MTLPMTKTLTLFFIVEPPSYQYLACYLAASIRTHLPADVTLIGYCPAHRMDGVDPAAIETLRRMRCEVRTFDITDRFDPPYPHGNKLLACLEPRDTEFSGFMDSDILLIRDNEIENLVRPDHVSASAAASMVWAPKDIWDTIYGAFDMPVPEERIRLMRDRRRPMVPYYSSGFVIFPETFRTESGQSFPEVWKETADRIDAIETLEKKRPYLDQMSLPLAIRRAGLSWNELPEEQHYILGGKLRGKPFPTDREIYTVHYRKWDIVKENGLSRQARVAMEKQVGTRRVSNIWRHEPPEGITAMDAPKGEKG